jgi:hypothetical protein
LPERLRFRRTVRRLVASGLFDESWYVRNNPDVVIRGSQPLVHWASVGWREGRDPHPLFDTSWYLKNCEDAAGVDLDPVSHFLDRGASLDCNPNPLFDTSYYLKTNPSVATAGINPLVHYLRSGAAERRDPHPLFETARYLEQHPDVRKTGLNPLVHYVESRRKGAYLTSVSPAAAFDPRSSSRTSTEASRRPTMVDALTTLIKLGVPVKSVLDVGVLSGTAPLMQVFPNLKHYLF